MVSKKKQSSHYDDHPVSEVFHMGVNVVGIAASRLKQEVSQIMNEKKGDDNKVGELASRILGEFSNRRASLFSYISKKFAELDNVISNLDLQDIVEHVTSESPATKSRQGTTKKKTGKKASARSVRGKRSNARKKTGATKRK
ncbi:MAG: hypothetical protein ACOCU6_02005 [Nanoarchaeota archaeon]